MSQSLLRRRFAWVVTLLVVISALTWLAIPQLLQAYQPDPVAAAWEKARAAGSYHFASDVRQLIIPVAKVGNVGRMSRRTEIRLEGETDLRANSLQMQLWSEGGSVLQTSGGLSVKVENGQTFVRRGGGEWQAAASFADTLAPQGDFMAYLAAVRNVQAHTPEQRGPAGQAIRLTRYSFVIDGPTFAAYVRHQLAAALRAQGELPPGVTLAAPQYYQEMTGNGELWVGENGLPLRQILNLNFPEQQEQTTHAQIVVDFSHFGASDQSLFVLVRAGDWARFGRAVITVLPSLWPGATPWFVLFLLLACVMLILHYRRTRLMQTALAGAVITSLVVGPLLSTFKIDSFFAAQAAKAAAQKEAQAAADAAHETSADLGQPEFNPQVNPLQTVDDGQWELPNQSLTLSPPYALALQTTDTGADADADGLSDFAEARVGTDETLADSDDDGISDGLEVRGFTLGGQTWYANAQNLDSNNDGIGDGQEWSNDGNSQPDDTDGDNIPDLFDADNDNDGAPDRQDLAPFSASAAATPFTENNPFQLTINNLTANVPTLVDFQLRPTDPNHLWYAFNVLDWPRNDNAGQIQDVDGKTYADLAASQGRMPGTNEAFGDMKLTPMLEIRITGAVTNLPPQAALTPYNIAVRNLTDNGSQQAVYIPLSLVTDEQSGQRVAFTARMNYLPTGAWPAPQDVRLAWVLQILTDIPCDHADPQDVAAGCAGDDYIHNAPQVVQTYYDDFTLTGLNVSEEHGAKTALIYEDPAVDPNLKDDVSLTALTLGLDHSFLAARDVDNNSQRDVDIQEIARRFDHTTNSSVPSDQRWGLDGVDNILRVERHDYPTFDQAATSLAMTDTLGILANRFNSAWAADNSIKPTIAYVYEQQTRSLGLDASKTAPGSVPGYVTLTSTGVTVNMQPAGQPKAALNTIAGLRWMHYCRANSTVAWDICTGDGFWMELESRYGSLLLPGDNDPDIATGSNVVMQLYNLALTQGAQQVVQIDNQLMSGQYTLKSDNETAANVRDGLTFGGMAVKVIANRIVMERYLNAPGLKKPLGNFVTAFLSQGRVHRSLNYIRFNPSKGTALAVAAGVGISLMLIGVRELDRLSQGNSRSDLATRIILRTLVVGVQTYGSLIDPALTVLRWSRSGASIGSVLRSSSVVVGVSKQANLIGAVIGVSIVWGFFIYSMVSNKVSAFGPEFNRALAETVAATIYIILLAALSATVIGLLIVGVVAVIDAILTAVCELGVDDLRTVPGLGGACFTLGATATKAIAYLLYNYDLMIDTSRSDMVAPGAPRTQLTNPNKGFVAGNVFTITMPITTHVVHKSPDPAAGIIIDFYLYLFSKDNLRSSTFNYTLTRDNPQDVGASRGSMSGAWQNVREDHKYVRTPMYGGYAQRTAALNGFNLPPGINQPAAFYLNMGYALPAYECWVIPILFAYPIPVCYTRTFDDHSSTKIDTLRYDIFPNTVGGLMALGSKTLPASTSGIGLNWDPSFPALPDADGDGMVSAAFGGLDPNDAAWNSDSDNLSDAYELAGRAAGIPYSLNHCDTDSDGLTDGQEAQIGSNPAIRDSDNDGLEDDEEVWHQEYNGSCQPTANWSGGWDVTINAGTPFTIRVFSDPTQPDADADGVSDLAEKQLVQHSDPTKRVDKNSRPWHPNVFNVSPITVLTNVDDADRIVAVGQNLRYTTTVIGDLPLAPSLLDITAPGELGGARPPALLTFDAANTAINQTELAVDSGNNQQQLQLTSGVRARLTATGPSVRTWDPIAFQTFAPTPTHPNRFMAASAYLPGKQDSFLFARLSSNNTNRGGLGDLRTNTIPTGGANTLFTADATSGPLMGNNPPDMACNNLGTCLVVWDQVGVAGFTTTTDRAYYAVIRPDGSVSCCGNLDGFPDSFHPAVATDGTNFVVAHVRSETSGGVSFTTIYTAYFDSNGARNFSKGGYWDLAGVDISSSNIALDFIYTNGYYVVAWKWNDTNFAGNHLIRTGLFDADGHFTNGNNYETTEAHSSAAGAPVMAINPTNGNLLLLYQGSNGEVRRSVMNSYVPFPTYAVADGPLGNDPITGNPITGNKISATFDPRTYEWLITVDGRLLVYDQYLFYPQMPSQDLALGNNVPVACPALRSLPVADLRFEEFPGATSFGGAWCSGNSCPVAGLPGATDSNGIVIGVPASDYAIQFDGRDDEIRMGNPLGSEFSLAFWYKASSGGGTAFFIESGEPNGMGFFHYNDSGVTEFFAGGTRISANTNLSNGQWRFVTVTRASNGALALYLDGNPTAVATAASSPTPTMTGEIRIGGGSTSIGLDNLLLYKVALNPSSVQEIYSRTTQSFCVGAQGNRWTKLNTTTPDTRGGKITASGSLTLKVDRDLPTAIISGLTNNQYILGNTVHTIGGGASDATSGVARVEISVNNGPWEPASGAESWAYNLNTAQNGYLISVRAIDNVGNVGNASPQIFVTADATPPSVALNTLPAGSRKPTRNAGSQWQTTLGGDAADSHAGLAADAVEVQLQGQGAAVAGSWQKATIQAPGGLATWTIDYTFAPGVADPTGTYTVNVRAVDKVGNYTANNAATGILQLDAAGPAAALSSQAATRQVISDTLSITGMISDTGAAGADKLDVAFVSVEAIAALPADVSATQADALLNRTWLPATLAQPGARVSTWTLPTPAGLEGEYQIDLRGADTLGNILRSDNAWRGVIDTLAPRVVISSTRAGPIWTNDATGEPMYDAGFRCTATDRYLDDSSFACPAGGATPVRIFDTTAVLQTLFPDRTIRNGLTVAAAYWEPDPNATIRASACDLYGHCTTISTPLTPVSNAAIEQANSGLIHDAASLASLQLSASPKAVVVAPTQGNFVAVDGGALNVTVAAEASALLKEVVIRLDNQPVQTLNFAQNEAITRTLRTIRLSGVNEGPHTLTALATDWANATQSVDYPIAFTLDAQAPNVSIDPVALTVADTWQAGSGILRFNGAASDNMGLAAVQIREGDTDFIDVEFGAGVWQTALPVDDPEGRTLRIEVRAIDRAGRISTLIQNIGANLSAADAPDTTITTGPAVTEAVNTATLVFTGTSSARSVVVFDCQLDGAGFTPCASPMTYSDLSKGSHTFAVRSVDSAGNVDLTPAQHTWIVSASALDATITSGPANPTSSRTASFAFTGNGPSFDCALDGASFAPCTSPQSYRDLANGGHSFQVRSRGGGSGAPVGAAARYVWTINNAAPVANSQVLTSTSDTALDLTLTASDEDPLTYQIIQGPAHGVLLGLPPNLTFTPDRGATATDLFTFRANDGLSYSAPATITIVLADIQAPTANPTFNPLANAAGWHNRDVTVTWNWRDDRNLDSANCPATSQSSGEGRLTLTAACLDQSGNRGEASVILQVDKTAPETTLTGKPEATIYVTEAAFAFTGSDANPVTFECSLDGAAYSACTSPHQVTALTPGSHTFAVRSVDMAENRDATPASYAFTLRDNVVIATCFGYAVRWVVNRGYVADGWSGGILVGTAGNDTIRGTPQSELILGLGGKDKLEGKGGADRICGGEGEDTLLGNSGNEELDGGPGDDKLNGGAGFHDVLLGAAGKDTLSDPDGAVTFSGGPDNDTLSLVFKSGWRNPSGVASFNGLTAGYGDDKVNLTIGGKTPLALDISGDERDNPASPLEGAADRLTLKGPVAANPLIIKFEQSNVQAADLAVEVIELDEAAVIAEWQAAGDWVSEEETTATEPGQLFLPVVSTD